MKAIGYAQNLFVQPFDHRGSFTKKFFNLAAGPRVSVEHDDRSAIGRAKSVIYRGLLKAIEMGVPQESVGLLVDSEFGSPILQDAKAKGIPTAVCVEKSGQAVFDFEYGSGWQDHLRFYKPDIVKCLVRHHPQDSLENKLAQMVRLKMLSDFLHASDDAYFMFELLVPALTDDEKSAGEAYDKEQRPHRMVEAIHELQDFGIEPDIWKIEGVETREQAERIAEATRRGDHRRDVGNIVLGRGSDAEQVHHWLRVAAPVPAFIGFAVGRTNFAEAVKGFIADPSTEGAAIDAIARNYKSCVDTWLEAQ